MTLPLGYAERGDVVVLTMTREVTELRQAEKHFAEPHQALRFGAECCIHARNLLRIRADIDTIRTALLRDGVSHRDLPHNGYIGGWWDAERLLVCLELYREQAALSNDDSLARFALAEFAS